MRIALFDHSRLAAPADREVVLCVPLQTFSETSSFLALTRQLSSRFGARTRIASVSTDPERWVIESDPTHESAIPSLALLDSAFQGVETLPRQIDQVSFQIGEMQDLVERCDFEAQRLKNERSQLLSQIEELESELRSPHFDRGCRRQTGEKLRKSCQRLTDRLLPPSEIAPDELPEAPPPKKPLVAVVRDK
jgi:hypothetical protein